MKILKISKYLESFFIVRLIKQKRYTRNKKEIHKTKVNSKKKKRSKKRKT